MKTIKSAFTLWAISFFTGIASISALEPTIIKPEEIKWPGTTASHTHPGTEIVHLSGDPRQDNMFVMRIKFPPKTEIKPHTHPIDEYSTIISGTVYLGFGKKMDRTQSKPLSAGTFVKIPAGTPHYAWSDDGAVVQITGKGPWRIDYIKE